MTWQKGWTFNITLDAHQCLLISNAMMEEERKIKDRYESIGKPLPLSEKTQIRNYAELFVIFHELHRRCKDLDAKENAKVVKKK